MQKFVTNGQIDFVGAGRELRLATPRDLRLPDSGVPIPGDLAVQEGDKARPDGKTVGSDHVREIIRDAFSGKLHPTWSLHLGDERYYLPTLLEVQQVLSTSTLKRRRWILERHDCDDFAYILRAFFSSISYINDELEVGLCCGMIWGEFDWLEGFHACNWVITDDMTLRLIEPQRDTLYLSTACQGSVTFMAA